MFVDKWYFGKIGKKIAEQIAKKYDGKITDFGRGDDCWAIILPIDPTGLSELKKTPRVQVDFRRQYPERSPVVELIKE